MYAQCNYGLCRGSRVFEPGDIEGPGTALYKHWLAFHPDKPMPRYVATVWSDGDVGYQTHNKVVA